MSNFKLIYSMQDVTKRTGFSRPKLYELMKQGLLPSTKVGGSRVFTQEYLKVFVKNCNTISPSSTLDSANVV